MTPYLKEGDNVLAVRVDHSRYADSRWYTGSGIYRDVWLVAAPDTHIAQWGVGWHAASLTDKQAVVAVDVEVEKHKATSDKLELKLHCTILPERRCTTPCACCRWKRGHCQAKS